MCNKMKEIYFPGTTIIKANDHILDGRDAFFYLNKQVDTEKEKRENENDEDFEPAHHNWNTRSKTGGAVKPKEKLDFHGINLGREVSCFECEKGDKCDNSWYAQEASLPQMEIFETERMGKGVRALAKFKKGDYVGKYVGKITKTKPPAHHLYVVSIDNFYVDAEEMGSVCRYFNSSCSPNLRMLKTSCGKWPILLFFAIKDIEVGEEINYNYRENYKFKECLCDPCLENKLGRQRKRKIQDQVPAQVQTHKKFKACKVKMPIPLSSSSSSPIPLSTSTSSPSPSPIASSSSSQSPTPTPISTSSPVPISAPPSSPIPISSSSPSPVPISASSSSPAQLSIPNSSSPTPITIPNSTPQSTFQSKSQSSLSQSPLFIQKKPLQPILASVEPPTTSVEPPPGLVEPPHPHENPPQLSQQMQSGDENAAVRFMCKFEGCSRGYLQKKLLTYHEKHHHMTGPDAPVWKCDTCERTYTTKAVLTKHLKVVHNDDGGKSAPSKNHFCIICESRYSYSKDVYTHIRAKHANVKEDEIVCCCGKRPKK
ncbi:unnamed protein product [Orchesella dallaii]|uniref:Uncharacterized protein n=1 Tax=Orchesella dallaii TaxID=48710 RepID=A0ABP1RRT0_9HEXA